MDIYLSICMGKLCQCHHGGVGMHFGYRALKSLNGIKKIQPRMMVATFNSNPSTTVISCYSPTNASDEMDLITFYNALSSLACGIPKHNILIISRDMNAKIGRDENKKFCLHDLTSRKEEHLTEIFT